MKTFKCKVAQKGFFAGNIYSVPLVKTEAESSARIVLEDEVRKFEMAKEKLKASLGKNNISDTASDVLGITADILEDEAFIGKIRENIYNGMSFEKAVKTAAEDISQVLNAADSEYISQRQEDIRGISDGLILALDTADFGLNTLSAVCAKEVSPALIASFDESLIGGLLTEKGSPNSHASIIAGDLDIPYLYGMGEAVEAAENADFIILDGMSGTVITDPDEDIKQQALERMERILCDKSDRQKRLAESIICKTGIYANISGPEDIGKLLENNAGGVGLFRTEFLFLNADKAPTEEEQFEAYKAVLMAMGDKEVIIRTMDIGSDKKVFWMNFPQESNPALGLRGIRVSLEFPELFKVQLAALLRAACFGNLKIMFPMITSLWELKEAKKILKDTARELEREGVKYKIPPVGIMIETPAAALCAETLAKEADFFSIGTNDLTQYTLSLDRETEGLDRYFDKGHEAVFTLISNIVTAAHKNGIKTGVCGQMAADPDCIKRLVCAGVDELSVPVNRIAQVKALAAQAEEEIKDEKITEETEEVLAGDEKAGFKNILAAADGEFIPMEEIPDEAFSSGSMGKCFGILPENGNIYSPVDGIVEIITDGGHAIAIRSDDGRSVIVHVGIDTVSLKGKAFKHFVKVGDRVSANTLIMEADLLMIEKAGLNTMIITLLLD